MVSKGPAHERACHRCDAVHGTNEAGIDGALFKWNGIGNDDKSTTENAGRAYARNGTTNDQCRRRRSRAAERGTNLKDED